MKITNNRKRAAWFNYRVEGIPKRVFLKPYESMVVAEYNDIDQTLHNRTISNFSAVKPVADSGQTTNVISVKNIKAVNSRKISTDQQTDGNFEVTYTSS